MRHNAVSNSILSILLVTLVASGGLIGCSDDTIEHVTRSTDQYWFSDITDPDYFPLVEGLRITYSVTGTSDAQHQTYWIGEPATYGGATYYPWITEKTSRLDTVWFRETTTGLYYYSSLTATPECILSYPISTGTSWSRYDVDNIEGDNTELKDFLGGDDQVASENDGNGPIVGDFPVTGSTALLAEKIELLELKDGTQYAGALKVRNSGSGGYNCYWFVPGIGLARYAIGAADSRGETAAVVGEMVSYTR
jgi:hypothetical protein